MIFSKNKQTEKNKQTKTTKPRAKAKNSNAVDTPPLSAKKTGQTPMTKSAPQNFTATPMKPAIPTFNASRFGTPSHGSSDTRRLTVGKDICLSGEIATCDHLVVEGTVEATIKGGQTLEITETGLFKGTVEIEDATIAGRFEGNLVVKGHLTIRSTGSVSGDIHYGDLIVEAGASINGTVKCVGLPEAADGDQTKKVKPQPVFKTTTSPANEDDMLYEETPYTSVSSLNML